MQPELLRSAPENSLWLHRSPGCQHWHKWDKAWALYVGPGCLKGTGCLKGPGLFLGREAGREGWHVALGCPVHPQGSPCCLNLPKAVGSSSAQAMHIKLTLSHASPTMGWIPKETYATKSSCLFSLGDRSLTTAQATGIKQTQIFSRKSLAAPTFCLELAGASWQSKHPASVCSSFPVSPLFY